MLRTKGVSFQFNTILETTSELQKFFMLLTKKSQTKDLSKRNKFLC